MQSSFIFIPISEFEGELPLIMKEKGKHNFIFFSSYPFGDLLPIIFK